MHARWWRSTKFLEALALAAVIIPVFFLGEGGIRSDAFGYLVMGRNMADGLPYNYSLEHYLFPTFLIRPPMFSFVLAQAFRVGGDSIRTALFVSQAMTALSLVGVYCLTRSLYGRKTGLAALGIAAASSYLIGIAAHIEIDPAVTSILLLAATAAIHFLERSSLRWAVLAGITLAVALLIKEVAVMMAPLPFYLFLTIPHWRKKENILPLVAYTAAFATSVAAYMLYYYLQTGRIFLVNRAFESLNWQIVAAVVLPLTVGFGLLVLVLFTRPGRRVLNWIQRQAWILGLVGALLLFTGVTFILVIAFAQNSAWVRSPAELLPRLAGFHRWLDVQAAPLYWPFGLSIAAAIVVAVSGVYRRQRRDIVLLWLFLCTAPLILTLSPNPETIRVARYGFPIFWLIIILLARATMIVTELAIQLIASIQPHWLPAKVTYAAPVVLWAVGLMNVLLLPGSYAYDAFPLPPLVFNSDAVKATARWIQQHTNTDAVIGSTSRYVPALEFYTGRSGQFRRIYSWDGDLTELHWPQTTTTVVSAVDGEPQLHRINRDRVLINDPIYLQYSLRSSFVQRDTIPDLYYLVYSQSALVNYIQENEIDYLVLSTGNAEQNMLSTLPRFFQDHPAFEVAFQYTWPDQEEIREFAIYVLRVDRSKLAPVTYPIEISTLRGAWNHLNAQLQELLPEAVSPICTFIATMGGEPLHFTPGGATNFQRYIDVAESCLKAEESDLASYHYFLALRNAPDRNASLPSTAEQLIDRYPDSAAAWLLNGTIHLWNNDLAASELSIAKGMALNPDNSHVRSALFQIAGSLAFLRGDYTEAGEHFTAAAESDVFDTAHNAGLANLAKAANLWTQGNETASIMYLRQWIKEDARNSLLLYANVAADPILQQTLHFGFEQAVAAQMSELDLLYRVELTRLLLEAGSPSAAQTVVQALIESLIAEPDASDRIRRAYLNLTQLVAAGGDVYTEEALYSTIINRWPEDYRAYYLMGNLLYYHLGESEKAAKSLEQAVLLAPQEESIYSLLIEIYGSTYQTAQLEKLVQFATQQNPGAAWPHLLASEIYFNEWTAQQKNQLTN